MELSILFLLLVFASITYLFSKNNIAVSWICIALLIIAAVGVWMGGITQTSSVQSTPSNYTCYVVTNCTNAINSTCSGTNTCSNSFTESQKVVVVKNDAQTVALGLILVIFAVWLSIQVALESLEYIGSLGGRR